MKCDVTKVTYNMYTCYTCCISREMIEMDGRDRAMCQIVTKRDKIDILEFINEENDKNLNSAHLPPSKRRLKRAGEEDGLHWLDL